MGTAHRNPAIHTGAGTLSEPQDDRTSVEHERELIESGQREAAELIEAPGFSTPPPDAIPGHEIIAEIGRGGMGVVYKALQLSTKRIVALKVMLAGVFASRQARKRFQREVELAARFQHPGIVRVLESGPTATGHPYYAMDYVDGVPHGVWLLNAQRDVNATLRLFVAICDAVDHAHGHGVIHRDLKPANVLVDADGHPHILDFGLSKATDQSMADNSLTMAVSSPGQIMGTLRYLSPEQAAGSPAGIDARTDIYALGVMLFEALTGTPPLGSGASPSEMMRRIQEVPPTPPSSLSPRVNKELEAVILKALEKEKDRRYQSVRDLGEDIGRYLRGQPLIARSPSRLYLIRKKVARHRMPVTGVLLVLCLGLAASAWAVWQHRRTLSEARWAAAQAENLLDAGRSLDSCVQGAQGLFERHPEVAETCLVLAQAQFRQSREAGKEAGIDTVIELLRNELTKNPAPWAVRALLAEVTQSGTGDPRAAEWAAEAERQTPDTADAWYVRSFSTLDTQKAKRFAERAVGRDVSFSLAWNRLAYLRLHTDDFAGALKAAEELNRLRPNPVEWATFAGLVHLKAGRHEKAVDLFTQAIELASSRASRGGAPSDNYTLCNYRATAHLCLRNYARALDDYNEEIKCRGSSIPYWTLYRRATVLWITGRRREAAGEYREFRRVMLRPSYGDARLFLVLRDEARVLEQAGRTDDADKAAKEATQALEAARPGVPPGGWLASIFDCLAGNLTPDQLVASVDRRNRRSVCEAYCYAGEVCLLRNEPDSARDWFAKCVQTGLMLDPGSFPDPLGEYHLAVWRLSQLTNDVASRPAGE